MRTRSRRRAGPRRRAWAPPGRAPPPEDPRARGHCRARARRRAARRLRARPRTPAPRPPGERDPPRGRRVGSGAARGAEGAQREEGMTKSAIARLNDFGQSPWYDNLSRALVRGGGLARLIEDDGIRGVTSNPTILDKAIAAGEGYDEQL